MGVVLSRKVVTTDASLSGWDGVHNRRCERLLEHGAPAFSQFFLELLAVFHSLLSFVTKGPSCPGVDRQFPHGGLYQLSGEITLPLVVHASVQTDSLELQSFSLSE